MANFKQLLTASILSCSILIQLGVSQSVYAKAYEDEAYNQDRKAQIQYFLAKYGVTEYSPEAISPEAIRKGASRIGSFLGTAALAIFFRNEIARNPYLAGVGGAAAWVVTYGLACIKEEGSFAKGMDAFITDVKSVLRGDVIPHVLYRAPITEAGVYIVNSALTTFASVVVPVYAVKIVKAMARKQVGAAAGIAGVAIQQEGNPGVGPHVPGNANAGDGFERGGQDLGDDQPGGGSAGMTDSIVAAAMAATRGGEQLAAQAPVVAAAEHEAQPDEAGATATAPVRRYRAPSTWEGDGNGEEEADAFDAEAVPSASITAPVASSDDEETTTASAGGAGGDEETPLPEIIAWALQVGFNLYDAQDYTAAATYFNLVVSYRAARESGDAHAAAGYCELAKALKTFKEAVTDIGEGGASAEDDSEDAGSISLDDGRTTDSEGDGSISLDDGRTTDSEDDNSEGEDELGLNARVNAEIAAADAFIAEAGVNYAAIDYHRAGIAYGAAISCYERIAQLLLKENGDTSSIEDCNFVLSGMKKRLLEIQQMEAQKVKQMEKPD